MKQGLVNAIFNTDIHSLTEEDVLAYFNSEKRETNTIEFKAYIDDMRPGTTKEGRDNEKLETIIKSICAFLNSDGGILIWGAPKGKKGSGSERIYKGSLTPVELSIEPDQFTNKISSAISPMPRNILFHSIPLNENSFCYLFEVDKSEFSPHQYKGTYYMRMDGSTRPAPHHFVEALMKKISFPRLLCSIEFGKITNLKRLVYIPLVITVQNLSKFIQEKNVQYRLLSTRADILEPDQKSLNPLEYGTDVIRKATDLLHYKMPVYENYVLVANRMFGRERIETDIVLTVWGELSPVIACFYKLKIFCNPQFALNDYELEVLHDNIYLMDLAAEDIRSDKERLEIASREFLDIHVSNFKNTWLCQYLSNYESPINK